jgi:hypothetical protein
MACKAGILGSQQHAIGLRCWEATQAQVPKPTETARSSARKVFPRFGIATDDADGLPAP